MSQPPEVEALTRQLLADIDAVYAAAVDELAHIAAQWWQWGPPARENRLQILTAQLAQMRQQLESAVLSGVGDVISTAYEMGAFVTAAAGGVNPLFLAPDTAAIVQLAGRTSGHLLQATKFLPEAAKSTIRSLARQGVRDGLYTGLTPTQSGRTLAQQVRERGIRTVTYSDGSQHSLSEYAHMVMRTETALAYNTGSLNQGERQGWDFYEISDGPGCGLRYHDDPDVAQGKVVKRETAERYPIAHPNCRRAYTARPDVTSLDQPVQPRLVVDTRASVAAALASRQAARARLAAYVSTPAVVRTAPITPAARVTSVRRPASVRG